MKRRVLFIILFLAVIGGLVWLVLHQREPRYQGRPLSYWVRAFDIFSGTSLSYKTVSPHPSTIEAAEALRQMGTNAFPKLLQMVGKEDSALKLKCVALAQKQQVIKIDFVPAKLRNTEGGFGLEVLAGLGFDLGPLVPDLIKIHETSLSSSSVIWASEVLGSLGPAAEPAVPALVRSLTNDDLEASLSALNALCHIRGRQTNWIVAELTKASHSPSPTMQMMASLHLASSGRVSNPVEILFLLILQLKRSNDEGWADILNVLTPQSPKQPAQIASVVAKLLHDPHPVIRQMACLALQRLYLENSGAPEPGTITALIETLKDPDPMVRATAARVLKQLDPVAAAKAGVK